MILDRDDNMEATNTFLFYLPDKKAAADAWKPNCLYVGPVCKRPEDLNLLEQQYRFQGSKAPMLFDDGDGEWGPRAAFASAIGVQVETLTLEAAEQWLIERHAGTEA
jgi:hypothetical protein